ncbi:MAG: helix-turn-helix domain-containing protein [Streptomycetaceae bacterium]|nr:helix-turn-helix domain-containing protein [Streptomycetaceae bacterium]
MGGYAPDVETWRGTLRDAVVELDATPRSPADPPDYTGWAYMLDLGAVNVVDVASDPVRVARTPRLIHRNPVDFFHLSIARRPSWAAAGGHRARLLAGDAMLMDSTDPWGVAADDFAHFLVVNVPRTSLRHQVRSVPAMLGQVIPADNPTLRVLLRVIAELGRESSGLPPETLRELGHTTDELVASTLRLAASGQDWIADAQMSRAAMLMRMREFALAHLDDPRLSPKMLADAFDVSLRYVEATFHDGGLSPSRFIREARMAEARRMLADPRHRPRSIAAIARSVGIENTSVFSRAFRNRYGLTPRDYRHSGGDTIA